MSFFRPTRNADFLRSRTLFFVVVLVLHLIWSIVAVLDVSSTDTRRSTSHVAVAAYNLTIQVVCFAVIALLATLDKKNQLDTNHWFSHVFFEVVVYIVLAVLQLAGALAYSALSPTFKCGNIDGNTSCLSAYRAILVGSWTITLLYLLFAIWFTISAVLAAKQDPSVWRSRSRSFDWAGRHSALITPSSPLDILGAEKIALAIDPPKPRRTWVMPALRQGPRPRLISTPHLPIQSLPPPTPYGDLPPVPPIPEINVALARQSIPEDISLNEDRDEVFRPVSYVQSLAKRAKIMSIKPLRLHKSRSSVDKSTIGLPKVVIAPPGSLTDSKYYAEGEEPRLTVAESQFNSWWNPESSFARQVDPSGFPMAPTIAPTISSRYSRATTVPPTPPPKDRRQRLPQPSIDATLTHTPSLSLSLSQSQSQSLNQSQSQSLSRNQSLSRSPSQNQKQGQGQSQGQGHSPSPSLSQSPFSPIHEVIADRRNMTSPKGFI